MIKPRQSQNRISGFSTDSVQALESRVYQKGAYANLKMSEIHDFFRQQYGEFRSRKLTWNVYIFLRSTTTFGIGCLHGIYTVGFYCQKSKSMNMH